RIDLAAFDQMDVYAQRTIDLFEFADGTVLTYEQLLDRGFDFEGSEYGDDIVGTNVVDRIEGGEGYDYLQGGEGSDVYIYRLGDGYDWIYDSGGEADTLRFGEGISYADLSFDR